MIDYLTKVHILLRCPSFLPIVLSLFQDLIQDSELHVVTMSPLALTISQTFLVCDDHLDSFEEFWLCILQNVPLMNLSDIFLMT